MYYVPRSLTVKIRSTNKYLYKRENVKIYIVINKYDVINKTIKTFNTEAPR